jgi:hypothetical protein
MIRFLHRLRPAPEVVPQFIRREVALRKPIACFETNYFEPGLCQRQSRYATSRAESDDYNVGVFQPSRH